VTSDQGERGEPKNSKKDADLGLSLGADPVARSAESCGLAATALSVAMGFDPLPGGVL
jgi:hypothetical protein